MGMEGGGKIATEAERESIESMREGMKCTKKEQMSNNLK